MPRRLPGTSLDIDIYFWSMGCLLTKFTFRGIAASTLKLLTRLLRMVTGEGND